MNDDTTASWTAAERAAFDAKRRSRNIALGIVLGLLAVLFFGVSVVKMSPQFKATPVQPPAAATAPK